MSVFGVIGTRTSVNLCGQLVSTSGGSLAQHSRRQLCSSAVAQDRCFNEQDFLISSRFTVASPFGFDGTVFFWPRICPLQLIAPFFSLSRHGQFDGKLWNCVTKAFYQALWTTVRLVD